MTNVVTSAERPQIGKLRVPKGPRIVEQPLGGGVTLLAVRQPRVPLVEFRLAVPVGADQVTRPALSLVGSESIFAGTEHHDRSSFAMAVERLGGHIGASVDSDRYQIGASALTTNLAPLLELVCEALLTASYPVADVRSDRERVSDEIVLARSQPETLAGEALRRRLYGSHPYGVGLPSPAAVRRVSSQALRSLHEVVWRYGGAHLVLVGDIDPTKAARVVAETLGPWLSTLGAAAERLAAVPTPRPGPMLLIDRPGAVQSNLRLARPAPDRRDPRWPASALANLAFGGMFGSRLVENLRERHGYTYSPRSAISHSRAGSMFGIHAEVATPSTAASLVETIYELGRFAVLGIEPSELESARRYALGTLSYSLSTQAGTAGTLARLAVEGIGTDYLAEYAAAIAKVTKEEADEAAESLFAPSGLIAVVLGDAGEIASSLERLTPIDVRSVETY
jgi:zinc protease